MSHLEAVCRGGRLRATSRRTACRQPERGSPRFLLGFALAVGGLLAFLALGNLLIDPYGAFGLWRQARVNAEKTELMARGGRVAKSLQLQARSFDTVLVGTSRVLLGLDPESVVLRGRRTYNAGLGGTNMYELERVLAYVADHQPALRQVIFGLDLLLFNPDRTVRGDYAGSGFAGNSRPELYGYALLAFGSALDSLGTLQANLRGERALQRLDGFQDAPPIGTLQPGSRAALAQSIAIFARDDDTYAGLAANGGYDIDRMALLRSNIDELTAQGVAVSLFISPMHALLLETLIGMGLEPAYEAWKRDLTRLVDEIERSGKRRAPVSLWDFGTHNSITTEPVPAPGTDGTMAWYWEASHYRAALGDQVLARLLKSDRVAVPDDFGQRLTPAMLQAHLAAERTAGRRYRCAHLADITALVGPAVRDSGVDIDNPAGWLRPRC